MMLNFYLRTRYLIRRRMYSRILISELDIRFVPNMVLNSDFRAQYSVCTEKDTVFFFFFFFFFFVIVFISDYEIWYTDDRAAEFGYQRSKYCIHRMWC